MNIEIYACRRTMVNGRRISSWRLYHKNLDTGVWFDIVSKKPVRLAELGVPTKHNTPAALREFNADLEREINAQNAAQQ